MKSTILGVLTLLLLTATASAQKAQAKLFTRAEAGVLRAALEIDIENDWHLYHHDLGHPEAVAKPTRLTLSGEGIEWGDVAWPEPEVIDQSEMGAGVFVLGHHHTIVLYVAGQLTEGSDGSEAEIKIDGLTCLKDGQCIPYRQTVSSKGKGADALFADFPADLVPAEWLASASAEPEPTGEQSSTNDTPPASKPVQGARASFQLFTRTEDDVVHAILQIDVEPDWHIFHEDKGHPDAAATETTLDWRGVGITWGKAQWPDPEFLDQPIMGEGVFALGHHHKFEIAIAGRLAPGANVNDAAVGVNGQTCQENGQCIPIRALTVLTSGAGPDELFADFPEDVVPPAGGSEPDASGSDSAQTGSGSGSGSGAGDAGSSSSTETSGGGAETSESSISEGEVIARLGRSYEPRERGIGASEGAAEERSLAMWMLFAFIAGLILNIMPCVLPVVSIKVLSFVNQAGESRGRVFALGLAFCAGILVVFVALGALAAFAGKSWGSQFQSTAFLVVMIAVVFAFSLSLFGLFELGVPSAVGQMAGQQQRREGLPGAFSMGILSTLLATPCSGPFLGSTLAWAVTQPPTIIMAIFAMAGVGMAFPYAILTSNPAFLKYVPKPGAWMETFKHLMGFLLLFTMLFLMASVPDEDMLYLLTFLVFVGMGCWIWGHFATFDQKPGKRMVTLAWVAVAFCGGGFLSFRTLPEFFAEEEIWQPFDFDKLVAYQDEGRNVFVDFTADWCLTCKTNEKVVYESEGALDLFDDKDVIVMKADETNDKTEYVQWIMALREHLGSTSIPFSAVFPADNPTKPYIFRDLVTPEGFREALESLPDPR